MVGILNPNSSRTTQDYDLLAPRNAGRGSALDSAGVVKSALWISGYVVVNGEQLFALAQAPVLLDVSFDQVDRPVIAYRTASAAFIWFYNAIIVGYENLNIGDVASVAICNDFSIGGSNIVCVYVASGNTHYRLQTDRFATDYTLVATPLKSISSFGIGHNTNSLNVVGPKA